MEPNQVDIPRHIKTEWPHLIVIRDAGELDRELERVRIEYNTVRLHAAIGYVTPDDEHEGRGEGIRRARRTGLRLGTPTPDSPTSANTPTTARMSTTTLAG